MQKNQVASILSTLTLEEKASLLSGADFWSTVAIERAGVPSIAVSDGPHGVRKQATGGDHLGLLAGEPATCFPPATGLGSSWDSELIERVGRALGQEALALNVSVLLGPGINIKRDPRCGRNFEYLSEDPLHAGVLGGALVRGIQSRGVGASVKHFAANNQETDRMRVSAEVDERTLRELYFPAFRRIVHEESPWTVMCSYNRINGVFGSEDRWLLTEVLREDWGFDGLVVSDWGAVSNRPAALAAGLDLEMPTTGGRTDAEVVAAVRAGTLPEDVLNASAARVIELALRGVENRRPETSIDVDAHHALAREAAAASVVLLRNEGGILPLPTDSGSLAVIGEFARTPRYQGSGSSQIVPTRLDNALDEIRALAPTLEVSFAAGFRLDGTRDAGLTAEAITAAAEAETVLYFCGLPDAAESEGFDRADIDLPADQLGLLAELLRVNPRVIVVLSNGGVVRLSPWSGTVPALLEGWLLGQAGGGALADVIFGRVNPSGRLAETIPERLCDVPAYTNFPGEQGRVHYGEGLYVGYRHYDTRDAAVAYPFGFGLSYTTFSYGEPAVRVEGDRVVIDLDVTNTGERDGREIVQVYTGLDGAAVSRPVHELRAFSAVAIAAGQTARVSLGFAVRDLAYYHVDAGTWVVEPGTYRVEVGASSRDLRHVSTVAIAGDANPARLSGDSTLSEWFSDPVGGPILQAALTAQGEGGAAMGGALGDPEMAKMAEQMPLRLLVTFGAVDTAQIDALIAAVDAAR